MRWSRGTAIFFVLRGRGTRRSIPTDTLFPYSPLFRAAGAGTQALFGGLRKRECVDMRGNAADRAAVLPREEKLRLAMFEPRILAGGDRKSTRLNSSH